ncbi:MAG TPA: tyrosine-type recombinase/integrase [Streptosporangiaceae bacterium]|nr:tyrosine-type recombinase/integrase [Streptosporangiaceae bacterium]
MEDGTTYDVRVYRTEVYKGARVTTYRVRWKVGYRLSAEDFRNAAQADSFRSSLLTAARKGEGFSLSTGRPVSWSHDESAITWYAVALDYTAAKWPYAAPNRRKSIAEALTDATEAMLVSDELPYPVEDIRRALRTWAFSDRLRGATEPPEDLSAIVCWLQTATLPVADLSRPGIGAARCRALLNRISRKQDRTAAAANTANRKRAVLNNLMQYAIEVGALPANPLKAVKWTRPRTLKSVNPRTVINSDQARRLLTAVGQQGERGERMVAFFGCMYYAALRPEEAVELRPENLASLPDYGWGELILTNSEPRSGTWWTDSGAARQRRELKHRPRGETRPVPIHPELVALLSEHLKKFPAGPDGRIFTGPRGGIFNDRAYLLIFHKARAAAFTPRESASLLARRPYDLRHAAVSTWLNAGVPAPQVAEWAGHSVDVLLRVYAKCISGQQHEAKRRIEEATRPREGE